MRHFCLLVAPTRGCCGTNQQSITSPPRRRRWKCKAPVQYRSAELIHYQLNWPSLETKVACDAGNYIKYLDNVFRFKHNFMLELDVCGLICLLKYHNYTIWLLCEITQAMLCLFSFIFCPRTSYCTLFSQRQRADAALAIAYNMQRHSRIGTILTRGSPYCRIPEALTAQINSKFRIAKLITNVTSEYLFPTLDHLLEPANKARETVVSFDRSNQYAPDIRMEIPIRPKK